MSRSQTLLLTLALVVVAGMLTTFRGPRVYVTFGGAPEDHAHNEVQRIARVVELYVMKTGDQRPTLATLVQEDAKGYRWLDGFEDQVPTDPWNRAYELRSGDQPNPWVVLSHGPDRQADTDDDIRSDRR